MKFSHIPLLIILITLGCKKTVAEIDKLPSATQTGANTFGCLVNGKAYTPDKDCYLCSRPLHFEYENSRRGGQFAIQAEYNIGSTNQSIIIGVDSCRVNQFNYFKDAKNSIRVSYNDYTNRNNSVSSLDTLVLTNGYINIMKFDLQKGIVSGTFEFELIKSGVESIKITNGRFDAKL